MKTETEPKPNLNSKNMDYQGKLYGHLGNRRYFDTGKTAADWDAMESELKQAKQITEIEVVNGKIELLEGLRIFYKGVDISDNNVIKKLRELEHLRDKLINELKLK